jgi:hypothetical protein
LKVQRRQPFRDAADRRAVLLQGRRLNISIRVIVRAGVRRRAQGSRLYAHATAQDYVATTPVLA